MDVTRDQLAKALNGLWVYAKNREGTHHAQVDATQETVDELWEHLNYHAEQDERGARVTVEALAAWLREHKIPVSGQDMGGFTLGFTTAPEATAENILEDITGNAHPMPVDAHACCEHAGHADRELRAMAAAVAALGRNDWRKALGALLPLDLHERARVIRWLASRFPDPGDDLPF